MADELDVFWVINAVLAIFVAVTADIVLSPLIIAVGVVDLAAYDYWFADRETWMLSLAAWTVRRRIPSRSSSSSS